MSFNVQPVPRLAVFKLVITVPEPGELADAAQFTQIVSTLLENDAALKYRLDGLTTQVEGLVAAGAEVHLNADYQALAPAETRLIALDSGAVRLYGVRVEVVGASASAALRVKLYGSVSAEGQTGALQYEALFDPSRGYIDDRQQWRYRNAADQPKLWLSVTNEGDSAETFTVSIDAESF